jgi:membrane fusion protein (multidrug efflux system)
MRRIHRQSIVLVFGSVCLLTACGKKIETPAPAPPALPAIPLTKITQPEAPLLTDLVATLEGSVETEVQAQSPGYVVKQVFQDGAAVRAGDVLFLVNSRPFHGDLNKTPDATVTTSSQTVYTQITAPIDGVAGRAMAGLGDLVRPGMTLMTLSTINPIKAVFTMPRKIYLSHSERIHQALALNLQNRPMTLTLHLSDGSAYPLRGRWDSVDDGGPTSTEPVTVVAIFPNPEAALRPGEFVKINESKP